MARIYPRSGGNNTSKILWGMPMWSEELEVALESKKIFLGGCCIELPTPSHYCNNCKRKILFDTSMEESLTCRVEFEIGGFHGDYKYMMFNCWH